MIKLLRGEKKCRSQKGLTKRCNRWLSTSHAFMSRRGSIRHGPMQSISDAEIPPAAGYSRQLATSSCTG